MGIFTSRAECVDIPEGSPLFKHRTFEDRVTNYTEDKAENTLFYNSLCCKERERGTNIDSKDRLKYLFETKYSFKE